MWWGARYGTYRSSEWVAFDDEAAADAWQMSNPCSVVWEAAAPEEWVDGDAA